jgi:hypothetical protein
MLSIKRCQECEKPNGAYLAPCGACGRVVCENCIEDHVQIFCETLHPPEAEDGN